MNSTLKVLVPVVLLLGGVFALTFFAQYTPRGEVPKDTEVVTAKKPLQFFSSTRRWLPREIWDLSVAAGDSPPGNLQDTEFTGFYEPGETQYTASFWFANTEQKPVHIQLKSVSCSTCSGGKVAAIPTEVTKQILQMAGVSCLPQGLVSGMPLLMAVPGAQLDAKRDTLQWKYHAFLKPEEVNYEVPAAPTGDKWAEQWGIVDLHFKAKPISDQPHRLSALFATSVAGDEAKFDEQLALEYMSAPPFELHGNSINVGELTDTTAPQTFEVLIFSSTRKPAQLSMFDVVVTVPGGVGGEPGPFVSAKKPVLVPESEYFELMKMLSNSKKRALRIQSAYRMEVTVAPKVGEAKLDIGRLERNVLVGYGPDNLPVSVVGAMRGPIYLSGSKDINFGFFAYSDEQTVNVAVETERSGVELRIVPELTRPKAMKVELIKQSDIGDRGAFKLKATMPAKEQLGDITDGVVVVEAKGPNPLRLRIPVTGRGR